MNSFDVARDGAFRHNGMEREQVELHTWYVSYVQELNLNISLPAVHYHLYFSETQHLQRPHVAYYQSTPTRRGGFTTYHAGGVTRYMKGSPRISYPLFSPIFLQYTAVTTVTILVFFCNLRGKKMWVERRRAVVLLLVGSVRKGLWWGNYRCGVPITIVGCLMYPVTLP